MMNTIIENIIGDIIENIINMVKQELDNETEEREISYTSLLQEIETVANEMKSN